MSHKPQIWKPGQSGNPKGKPKGALNRTSAEIKEVMSMIFVNNLPGIQAEIDKLRATGQSKEYLMFMKEFAKFFIPRPVDITLEGNINTTYRVVYDDTIDITDYQNSEDESDEDEIDEDDET